MNIQSEEKIKRKGPEIGSYGSYPESPYIVELESKYVQPKPEHEVLYKADGSMWGAYEIPKGKTIPHDPAKYSKLFKDFSMVIANLNEASIKMFMYIHEHIDINNDVVCIMKEDYLKHYGYAPTNKYTYYQALEGLLRADIIRKKAGSSVCYWINPNIIFNGDRTKLKNVIINKPKTSYSFNRDREEFEAENSHVFNT